MTDKRNAEYYRERRRKKAEAEGRSIRVRHEARGKTPPRWTPGTPIEVEEIEEL